MMERSSQRLHDQSHDQSQDQEAFRAVVSQVSEIGRAKHRDRLIQHAHQNLPKIKKTLRDLPAPTGEKAKSGIVISAGPSVHKRKFIRRILESGYRGSVIAVDGSYTACLREGLFPDYVLTIDPHPRRIVSWFGDWDFEENWRGDDYLRRQDLDLTFRNGLTERNKQNLTLVNEFGHRTKAILSSSAPENVVRRIGEGKFDTYWWNPLVDDPRAPDSITRQLYSINKLPSMNTGGNVGTAAWVFASTILNLSEVALVGMDFGYYAADTKLEQTQTYYELIAHIGKTEGLEQYFIHSEFPLTGERFFTDPTYWWYSRNFFQLLPKTRNKTFNCSEAGTLVGENLPCIYLDEFLKKHG